MLWARTFSRLNRPSSLKSLSSMRRTSKTSLGQTSMQARLPPHRAWSMTGTKAPDGAEHRSPGTIRMSGGPALCGQSFGVRGHEPEAGSPVSAGAVAGAGAGAAGSADPSDPSRATAAESPSANTR